LRVPGLFVENELPGAAGRGVFQQRKCLKYAGLGELGVAARAEKD
jgi:hypothetical protein